MNYARNVPLSTKENPVDTKKEMATRLKHAREQLEAIRVIFNDGMLEISKRYKCQVMQLSNKALSREMKKYDSGRVKRAKQSDGSTVGDDEDDA
jgi:hypothetical protein